MTDIDVDGVRETTPGSTDGTAEFGLWIGNRIVNPVERIRLENAWWSGLWTGSSSHATLFRDVTIATVAGHGVAIYNEHQTKRNTFERFNLGPNLDTGFKCEWNGSDGIPGGAGACSNTTYQDGTIRSKRIGVFLGEGSTGNVVRRVQFADQSCSAIAEDHGLQNAYYDNDFAHLGPGVHQILVGLC